MVNFNILDNYSILSLIKSIFFLLGLINLGLKITQFSFSNFKINYYEKISISFSISSILIIILLYPFILNEKINIYLLKFISYLLIISGLFFLLEIEYKKFIQFYKKNIYISFIISLMLISSVSPLIESDSINYHFYYPVEFIKNNNSYINNLHFEFFVLGNFISINLLHTSIKAFEYGSIVQGFSIFSILILFFSDVKKNFKLEEKTNYLIILCLSPFVLNTLITSYKPQIFYIFLVFSSVYFFLKFNNKSESDFFKISIYSTLCLYISCLGKFSYFLILPIITLWFFLIIRKNYQKIKLLLVSNFISFLLVFLPYYVWKFNLYDVEIINFFLNPFPNFPGNNEFMSYLNSYSKNNPVFKNFPLSLIFTMELKYITRIIGPIILIFLLHRNDWRSNNYLLCIIALSFLLKTIFLQNAPRFFLDEYYLYLLYLLLTNQPNPKKILFSNIYKKILYFNSFIISLIYLLIIITFSSGVINKNFYISKLEKYSWNYNLYSQLNNLNIDKNKLLLTELSGDVFYNGKSRRYSFHDYVGENLKKQFYDKLINLNAKYLLLNKDTKLDDFQKYLPNIKLKKLNNFYFNIGTKNFLVNPGIREAYLYEIIY